MWCVVIYCYSCYRYIAGEIAVCLTVAFDVFDSDFL